jgi:hypothetical protein
MSLRYDAVRVSDEPNDSLQLQEDRDVSVASEDSVHSSQRHEDQNIRAMSEDSTIFTQIHEDQSIRAASGRWINAAQLQSIVPAHKAEIPLGRPLTVCTRCHLMCTHLNNIPRRSCAELANYLVHSFCLASLELRHLSSTLPFYGSTQVKTRPG